jgi:hypothetical protein
MLLPDRFKEILATKGRDLTEIGLHDVALRLLTERAQFDYYYKACRKGGTAFR